MMEEVETLLDLLLLVQLGITASISSYEIYKSRNWINRRWWVRPLYEKRKEQGFYYTKYKLIKEDESLFASLFRMDYDQFQNLLILVGPYIQKFRSREPISPEERLLVTLRYLASGDSIFGLSLEFCIAESTIRSIIRECVKCIGEVLQPFVLAKPSTDKWKKIMLDYLVKYNLPNCCGAIDGKLIQIKKPAHSGTLFFNYKHYFSVNLLAVCDSFFRFTMVDIGAYGSDSDSGQFSNSWFGHEMEDGTLNLPEGSAYLPGSSIAMPPFFIGDEGFGLTTSIMVPYSGKYLPDDKRIFNYRLSRARSTIENAFGVMTSRWRILLQAISFAPEVADQIVLCVVCLHNWLIDADLEKQAEDRLYNPPDFIQGLEKQGWIQNVNNQLERPRQPRQQPSQPGQARQPEQARQPGQTRQPQQPRRPRQPSRRSRAAQLASDAQQMRDTLKFYFQTPSGEVPWQNEFIQRGRNRDNQL